MITATSIKKIMTKNVVTVSSTDNLLDIERIFRIHHLRHAPVKDGVDLVGMISLVDLRQNITFEAREDIANEDVSKLRASHIMAPDPVALQTDQTVREAAILFSENEFHAVPVLDMGSLVGIISTTDIIRFLMESIDELEENSTD